MKNFALFIVISLSSIIFTGCVEWTNYTNLGPTGDLTRLAEPKVAIITQLHYKPPVPEVSRDAADDQARALSMKYRPASFTKETRIDRAFGRDISHTLFRKNVTKVNDLTLIYGFSKTELGIIDTLYKDMESRTEIEYALLNGALEAVFSGKEQNLPPDLELLVKSKLPRSDVRPILIKRVKAIIDPLVHTAKLRLSDTMFAKTLPASTFQNGLSKVRKDYDYAIFSGNKSTAEHGEWTKDLPWFSFGIIPSVRRWDIMYALNVLDCRKDISYSFTMRCRRTQVVNLLAVPAMFYMDENVEKYHVYRAEKDYDDQIVELILEDMSTVEEPYAW